MASEIQIQTTPTHGTVSSSAPKISVEQKQRLIDNYQFEYRARKLRAQTSRQVQEFMSRFERRIVRIPQNLRTAKMGVLIDSYLESLQQTQPAAITSKSRVLIPSRSILNVNMSHQSLVLSPKRNLAAKRSSDAMLYSDKENTTDLNVAKKRSRLAAVPNPVANSSSRQNIKRPSQVLSPKCGNSRTLQASPFKTHLSSKPCLDRLGSSVKATVAVSTTANQKGLRSRAPATCRLSPAPTAAGTIRARKPVPLLQLPPAKPAATRMISGTSNTSSSSAATTVIRKRPIATTKKGIIGKVQGMASAARSRTATRKPPAQPPAPSADTGRRVLRSRK